MRDSNERIVEQMRAMQTELLKAFGPWQENVQVRVGNWKWLRPTAIPPWRHGWTFLNAVSRRLRRSYFWIRPPL